MLKPEISTPIVNDQLQDFLAKLPKNVSESFNEQQLAAMREALPHAAWNSHSIDLRESFGIFNWRYYFVFVSGRDKRKHASRRYKIMGTVKFMLIAGYFISSTLLGLLALYFIKSAYGIDIFKGYSFGIWSWFQNLTCS